MTFAFCALQTLTTFHIKQSEDTDLQRPGDQKFLCNTQNQISKHWKCSQITMLQRQKRQRHLRYDTSTARNSKVRAPHISHYDICLSSLPKNHANSQIVSSICNDGNKQQLVNKQRGHCSPGECDKPNQQNLMSLSAGDYFIPVSFQILSVSIRRL